MAPDSLLPRILVIDDTPANLLTLGTVLSGESDLQIATSGEMGLALANQTVPDLVLLDVMMPEMDGYETCRRLKADPKLRNVPVIFVTALADVNAESAGLALGAIDYISKPINVEIARLRVRNALERERLRKDIEEHRDHLEEHVKERTQALVIAKDAAEVANRAKTAFLTNISHELRTPLHQIIGMTDLIIRKASDSKQLDQLGKVKRASNHLLSLIESMLNVVQLESDQLTIESGELVLGELVDHAIALQYHEAFEKGLELVSELSPELANRRLMGDRARLVEILVSLIANAIKFTKQGRIVVRLMLLEDRVDSVLVRLEVQDNGIGISVENQKRVFNFFEQADNSMTRQHGGAGIGLAISKKLVTLMGGTIDVTSTLDEGSTFGVNIPLGSAESAN